MYGRWGWNEACKAGGMRTALLFFAVVAATACGPEPIQSALCDGAGGMALDEVIESSVPDESQFTYRVEQIEIIGDSVHFADSLGIHTLEGCGAEPASLAEDARPFNDSLVATDAGLAWVQNVSEGNELRALPPGETGPGAVLAVYDGYTHDLRTDGATLVWDASVDGFPDQEVLLATEIDGGEVRTLATGRYGWSFDIDDGVVYAAGYLPGVEPDVGGRVLFSLSAAGGEPRVLAREAGGQHFTGVVATEDGIYFLRAEGSDIRGVERIGTDGSGRESIDLGDAPVPDHLVCADGHVYGVVLSGEVYALSTARAPELVATTQAQLYPGQVAARGDQVLVADYAWECLESHTEPVDHGVPTPICVRSETQRSIRVFEAP